MSEQPVDRLDPRAWLLWGLAASLPPLIGRNPFLLIASLVAVLGVRAAWTGRHGEPTGWHRLLRLAVISVTIAVGFNLLTVHVGDRVLFTITREVPLFGGPITLNALVYGLLSGIAIVTLVLIGTTLGLVLDWTAMLRLLPARLSTVAVAGSVAWTFVPQTATAFGEIREAQMARGYRPRGARDLVPLVVPLLANGLERALTLAEALEARAFGAPLDPGASDALPAWRALLTVIGLTSAAVGVYLLAVGQVVSAALVVATAIGALVSAGYEPAATHQVRRTRYREIAWGRRETALAGTAAIAIVAQILALALDPAAFAYEPYPSLTAPWVNLPLLASLLLLQTPIALAR